ncbi:MAG: alanine:cation symporter family protein [Gammaproteobacteria bacterium]|nr:alanine:cation symporter family protein [Gammaproteobacteria bacterium]MBT8109549.1 alanine:cation symporter family protein [Gammaproteobacteria bacterium]NND46142.1 alanine:cation symporter family protein [Woeseiaceae bacterium]NNL44251.1 alanine:cation symporter family protein [Woeseiaceae bacterium]
MGDVSGLLATINGLLWHEYVLYAIVATGVVFTIWSGFSQYRAITHGTRVLRGVYDDPDDPGAINHFQALSAALSATVGLGNIGGVALAIALGGPGAMFWMWVIAFLGMSIKLTEVTMSMLYRNTDDPDNPHGGPMWVAARALERRGMAGLGRALGSIFCVCLLVSTATGGNMFQAWNVGELTEEYFSVPSWITGIVLALIVGAVIIGGIKRIGKVTGTIVPLMVALYLAAGCYVLAVNFGDIPGMFVLIVKSAFMPTEAAGAFIGGTAASAFLFGMKRAVFSNEAGQGSSPIAHSAAKTDEPVREGIVAGLEPFIDTLVVCTFTALIILSTGIWNRAPDVPLEPLPAAIQTESGWLFADTLLPGDDWIAGNKVTMIVEAHDNVQTGLKFHRIEGTIFSSDSGYVTGWDPFVGPALPTIVGDGLYRNYIGATLTAKAFDTVWPGLGKWLISVAAWFFAVSTMISWGYYGEQGVVFLAGEKAVPGYKLVYCLLIIVATLGLVQTDTDLDNVTGIGTAVLLFVNIPICWLFGYQAMRAYKEYIGRLKSGRMGPDHPPPSLDDLLSGRDVEKS